MEKEKSTLDELMSRQPFRVPEGFFEGFAEELMSRLPDKTVSEEPEKISIFTRMKPFLYLAAMFVGAMIMINIIGQKKAGSPENDKGTPDSAGLVSSVNDPAGINEDAEFLEYIEEMYVDKYALSYIDDFMDN